MPRIILPSFLSQRVGGIAPIEVAGPTAGAALRTLEERYPALRGWVLDEQGRVRAHVKLFLNGTEASLEHGTADSDELHIVAAISGG